MTEDDLRLDDLLAEASAQRPVPSPALMARILADAEAAARERAAPATVRPLRPVAAPRPPGWVAFLAQALGGWPALGGLAACAVLGVGLGAAPLTGLDGLTGSLWGDQVSLTLGVDDDLLSAFEG